jgi:hypothetical protein
MVECDAGQHVGDVGHEREGCRLGRSVGAVVRCTGLARECDCLPNVCAARAEASEQLAQAGARVWRRSRCHSGFHGFSADRSLLSRGRYPQAVSAGAGAAAMGRSAHSALSALHARIALSSGLAARAALTRLGAE